MHPILFLIPALVCGVVTAVGLDEMAQFRRHGTRPTGIDAVYSWGTLAATTVGAVVCFVPVVAWVAGVVL